ARMVSSRVPRALRLSKSACLERHRYETEAMFTETTEAHDESDQSNMGDPEGIRALCRDRAHSSRRHDPRDPLLALSKPAGRRARQSAGVQSFRSPAGGLTR